MQGNDLAVVVGKNTCRLHKSFRMTQIQLSELIDITPAFLSNMERGEKWSAQRTICSAKENSKTRKFMFAPPSV